MVPSTSVAATVVTAVTPSSTLRVAVAPPELLVITGASFVLVMVTVMVWSSVKIPSEARTITSKVLFPPSSCGFSKSRAVWKVSTPVVAPMLKNELSSPPLTEYVGVVPSASVATTVVTAVAPSATLMDALAPPVLLVITGASFTLVMVTVMAWSSVKVPSVARTVTW